MPKRNDYFMKIFLLTLVFTLSFFTSGCKIFPGFKKYISSDINVAGALTHSPNSFSPVEAGTIRLQSEEVIHVVIIKCKRPKGTFNGFV